MTTCTKTYTDIPFAHRQPNHEGHCRFIHGHNWSFEFEFVAREKDGCGFVVDFGKLKPVKNWLESTFDHKLVLNETDPLLKQPAFQEVMGFTTGVVPFGNVTRIPDCSCEGIAELALRKIHQLVDELSGGRVAVKRCTVWEDSKNSATALMP